jgi:hypothetical protein
VLTTIGAIGCTASATVCLFAWLALNASPRSPFLWSGLFVIALLADDAFRLHESYFPMLGLSQPVVTAAYALAGLGYLWFFRAFIRSHDAWLFLLGLLLLGTSAITDQLLGHDAPFILEDGVKFIGIVTWMLVYTAAALRELTPADSQRVG